MEFAIQNNAAINARAFATYALVPYLGILFCPGALVLGSIGVVNSYCWPRTGGRSASYATMVVGTLESRSATPVVVDFVSSPRMEPRILILEKF